MASYPVYYTAMKNSQWSIGQKLGVDTSTIDFQFRVMNATVLAVLAALVKTLADAGIPGVDDAALAAHLADVTGFNWDPSLI